VASYSKSSLPPGVAAAGDALAEVSFGVAAAAAFVADAP
jgi:hypothetical protein